MSCPVPAEEGEECRAPAVKQRRLVEAEERCRRDGGGDLPVSQEAEAAQALWEMTTWREAGEQRPNGGGESEDRAVNVTPHTPERGATEDHHVRVPRRTPERGDTGESARGTPHAPKGGETGEKHPRGTKPTPVSRDREVAEEAGDQRRRGARKTPERADAEGEPPVLSPLSSDSDRGDPRSCSEGDECCIVSVGTQPTSTERSMQALESVQRELRAVNERADRALLQLRRRYGQLRKPHILRRNSIISTIPGFWVTAFLNHPQLSAMIDDRDEDTLSYMTNLQVEDFTHLKSSCKIKFYFNPNPYFKNEVILKEFQYGSSGRLVSHSTPIRWWRGRNPSANREKSRGGNRSAPSFFSWFSDHSFPAADRIAAIIKEDLWPNPLQYYLIGEGESDDNAAEDSDTDNVDDCVVIVDDDEEGEEDEENEVHEILDNSGKQIEGTDDDDDEEEEEEVVEEESVPDDMVESTADAQGAGKSVPDPDDSGQSSGLSGREDDDLEEDG
ncbi:testis-specific Y-encoded-like protein 2 [Ascaphus truei]|uniref:testis-specific Y-encoded-like protein 2 n=1 Tax=Ascaphus truei TaxID=8439 RepID=UPI003F5A6794